jgi:hypothetical protein
VFLPFVSPFPSVPMALPHLLLFPFIFTPPPPPPLF